MKVTVIKKKHVEQLLEPVGTDQGTDHEQTEHLFCNPAFDAILCRGNDNGHLTAIRSIKYLSHLMNKTPQREWTERREAAYEHVHSLLQLLVD